MMVEERLQWYKEMTKNYSASKLLEETLSKIDVVISTALTLKTSTKNYYKEDGR